MKLRPYQQDIVKQVKPPRTLIVLPTGGGKTAIACEIMVNEWDGPVWFICHRTELVEQTVDSLARFGVEAGVIKAGYPATEARIQVAGIQTVGRRDLTPPPGALVIIDEAHTVGHYRVAEEFFDIHDGPIIGITATPWRTRRVEGVGVKYEQVIIGPTTKELIEKQFLVKPRVYAFENAIDLEGLSTSGSDFDMEEVSPRVVSDVSIAKVVDECLRLNDGRTAIVFCVNVLHAKIMAEKLPDAEFVVAETKNRSEIYDRLRSGETKYLCSVGVLTEGFDVPSVGCVVLARPTLSRALHVQMIGRGLRISKNKVDCLVLDFVGNCMRHGLVDDYKKYQMEPDYPGEPGDAPVRLCPECLRLVPLVNEVCECGYVFPPGVPKDKPDLHGYMVEVGSKEDQIRCGTAAKVFKALYGRFPPLSHSYMRGWTDGRDEESIRADQESVLSLGA